MAAVRRLGRHDPPGWSRRTGPCIRGGRPRICMRGPADVSCVQSAMCDSPASAAHAGGPRRGVSCGTKPRFHRSARTPDTADASRGKELLAMCDGLAPAQSGRSDPPTECSGGIADAVLQRAHRTRGTDPTGCFTWNRGGVSWSAPAGVDSRTRVMFHVEQQAMLDVRCSKTGPLGTAGPTTMSDRRRKPSWCRTYPGATGRVRPSHCPWGRRTCWAGCDGCSGCATARLGVQRRRAWRSGVLVVWVPGPGRGCGAPALAHAPVLGRAPAPSHGPWVVA